MDSAIARLSLNDRTPLSLLDLSFWQGTEVRIEFALFEEGSTTVLVSDFLNLADVQLEVHQGKTGGGSLLISGTTILVGDLNTSLTIGDWNAGTSEHGAFVLTAEEMNQTVPAGVLECWVTIFSSTTDGGKIVHGAGPFTITRSRASGVGTPPSPPASYYTKAEIDALLASHSVVTVINDTAVIVRNGISYSCPVFPIATPDGIDTDGLTVIDDTAVFTEDGLSYSWPVYPAIP